MSDLQVTNAFTDGDTVSATNFNTNYSDIVTYVNNRNSAAATWDAMTATSTSNVLLTANNSTGTQSIFQAKDNGTTVFEIFDGGYVTAVSQSFVRMGTSSTGPSTGVLFKVRFGSVTQTQSEGDISTERITFLKSGKYFITASLTLDTTGFPGSAGTLLKMFVYKNAASIIETAFDNATSPVTYPKLTATDILNISAGDYLELYLLYTYSGFGGGPSVRSSSFFEAHKLS